MYKNVNPVRRGSYTGRLRYTRAQREVVKQRLYCTKRGRYVELKMHLSFSIKTCDSEPLYFRVLKGVINIS